MLVNNQNPNQTQNLKNRMNNNEINNNINETATNSSYTVLIANRTGHETHVIQELEQTVEKITSTVEEKRNWVFINGAPFEFAGSKVRSDENLAKLRTRLQESPNAEVLLTGEVVGGSR